LVVTLLAAVPLTIGYLGQERYGLWATISSFVVVLQFADLGLGNGLLNAIAEAHGREDRDAALRYVSSAFFMLLGLGLLFFLGFGLTYWLIPWAKLFGVTSLAASAEAGPAIVVLVVIFIINLPLGIVRRVQMGYQEGFASYAWDAAGNLLGLGALIIAALAKASIAWLVLAVDGVSVVALLANYWMLFGLRRPWLRPAWRRVNKQAAIRLFRVGFLFFVLQLASTFAFTSDNLVVAQLFGAKSVTQYSVPARLFSVVTVLINMALLPLWPAYGEAIARGDILWVKRTLFRSLVVTQSVGLVGALGLIVAGPILMGWWTHQQVTVPLTMLVGFGAWAVFTSLGTALSMLLNGANVVRFQVIVALIMAVVALLGKTLLALFFGLPGVIWGTILAYIICSLIPTILYTVSLLTSMNQRAQ
jgi:O-antigen/teichoic acid export membrane protein